MGKPIKGSLERVLVQAGKGDPTPPDSNAGAGRPDTQLPAQFVPHDYILVQAGTASSPPIYIAKEITFKGKNWMDTHHALAENGLFMPTIKTMMNHFLNVKNTAQRMQGNNILYDGVGEPISQPEVNDLWDYLSLADNVYRNSKGVCWTWLDAKFENNNGKWYMETNHRVVPTNAQKEFKGQRIQLNSHYQQTGLVELDFNSDGLATNASPQNQYIRGENIYYWNPTHDKVAWFDAGSVWASLGCGGGPAGAVASLGVFACAEGTASHN